MGRQIVLRLVSTEAEPERSRDDCDLGDDLVAMRHAASGAAGTVGSGVPLLSWAGSNPPGVVDGPSHGDAAPFVWRFNLEF